MARTSRFTVLGGGGFIGGCLAGALRARGHEVTIPRRDEAHELRGHVIYCIGLTADFRERLQDTMEAHVCALLPLLRRGDYESFLYLSSTRIYGNSGSASEAATIGVDPSNSSDLYNISKLAGETLCLTDPRPGVRVARLSNIVGPGMGAANFLGSLIDEAASGEIRFGEAPESDKDYLGIDDTCAALETVALHGNERLYNIAAGRPVNHRTIAERLRVLTGCRVTFGPDAPVRRFPRIDVDRLDRLWRQVHGTSWNPAGLIELLPALGRSAASNPEVSS